MSLGYALYVSLVCTLFDWFGYGMYNMALNEPVVCGALTGLLLGDFKTGIIIGGTLQLIYLGVIGVGAAIPVNKTTATTIAVALTIVSKTDMETAIALAVPVAVMGQLSNMLAWTLNTSLMHIADKYAETASYRKMNNLTYVGSLIFFVCKFVPIFLCIFYGSSFVASLNENMPAWISNWLTVTTGMLPALGFGMLFSMMYKPKYVPYFIIGFVMCAVFGGSLLAVALLGVAAALINYFGAASLKKKGAN